ncbi:hypothetical protein BABINDRAFT_14986 [Babjeviella inositovora NRRL Y-12698]|uniref:Uncharacterized protein n=1 Tax=Babjeviella inositovora NRRL Y-12698 TaxID=984486 RepID=A0A1E3QJZ7_9ASCO|nr:uncharacterized protein BABINDRAFT_14986 [Babjeviella inositovora NRRL Y-12698]ODQ78011.1 hypothetical protein BABINDRAFT_14986 [Babjeviella inositovora NRRL Y-12698]
MSFIAKVKHVPSTDTLVLVPGNYTKPFPPAPERTLTLSFIRTPSWQTHEAGAYEVREYLRALLLGKEVKFRVFGKAATREFGDVATPLFASLAEHLVAKGYAKVKEDARPQSDTEEELLTSLEAAENKAKLELLGVWALPKKGTGFANLTVLTAPTDEAVAKSRKLPLTATVEKVISGDRIIVRIIVNRTTHILTPVLIAGIRCPRTGETPEPNANEAAHFVATRLLGRQVQVGLVGANQTGTPVAIVLHPAGNVAEKLLAAGYAEVADWQSSMIGSEAMGLLRRAEAQAKRVTAPKATTKTSGAPLAPGKTVTATVARVVSSDTLLIRLDDDSEHTVQLASIKAPRASNPATAPYVPTAREYVRKLAIGKTVDVCVEATRTPNEALGLDARPLVSVTLAGADLSATVVRAGFATVIRHNKQTVDERAAAWDLLLELETEATAAKAGLHSGKPPAAERIVDASESVARAKTFVNSFATRSPAVVEHVLSATRLRLAVRGGVKLTLLLGGLQSAGASTGPNAGLAFATKKLLQREVQFEAYGTDKVGGFIGNLYLTGQKAPFQVNLLSQGLVRTHEFSLSQNPAASEMAAAEDAAHAARKGLWADFEEPKEVPKVETVAATQFLDIKVTDISLSGTISFQLDDAASVTKFKGFTQEFNSYNSQPAVSSLIQSADLLTSPVNLASAGTTPKKGDVVSAKFAENGKYYRARVLAVDPSGKFLVQHIDFGNTDTVKLDALRYLPRKFGVAALASQARSARLAHVKLPPNKPTDYLTDALYALEDLCMDKKVVAAAVPIRQEVEFEVVLYDASKIGDASHSINKDLVAEGFGIVKGDGKEAKELRVVQDQARGERLGCWEFGDVDEEE